MNPTIGVGIVGFGYMGYFHLKRIEAIDNMTLIGVYDIDENKREQAVNENHVLAYESFDALLADKRIGLVVIATPNDSHYPYAMASLAAEKHVLCEKPAMMTLAQLEEVLALAEKQQRIFTTHQNRRWDRDYSVVKQVVENRLIGDVWTICSETFGQRGVCFGWRADPEKGGGMVYDWGIHLIDQLLMLFPGQRVTGVYARLRSILTPAVDDYFEIELDFEGDIVAHIEIGTFALQERPRWFVFGDKGTMKLDDFSGKKGGIAKIKDNVRGFARVSETSNLGPSRTMAHLEKQDYEDIDLPEAKDAPLEFYRNLQAAIRGLEDCAVRPEEMLRDMRVIEKVFESNRLKQRLRVSI